MTTENDWFMRQIKGAANMLGSALRLTIQHLDLGQFEDEQGGSLMELIICKSCWKASILQRLLILFRPR